MQVGIGGNGMKNVLCYGDSNTWGYNPLTAGQRHNYEDRWTTILQKNLGEDYLVIPEGLNGRTTIWDDPIKGCANGKDYLLPCLESHKPLDLVVIMLGTNDLKARLNLPACDIAAGVGVLTDIVLNSKCGPLDSPPKVLILVPPETRKLSNFKEVFGNCYETSKQLPEAYKKIADERKTPCVNIGSDVRFSDCDGIHYEVDQLQILGTLITEKVNNIFND